MLRAAGHGHWHSRGHAQGSGHVHWHGHFPRESGVRMHARARQGMLRAQGIATSPGSLAWESMPEYARGHAQGLGHSHFSWESGMGKHARVRQRACSGLRA